MTLRSGRHAVFASCVVAAALFLVPSISWSLPCVSVPAGTSPVLPCDLGDLVLSNFGSSGTGALAEKPAITFFAGPTLAVGFGNNFSGPPAFDLSGSFSSSIHFDVATQDGTDRIEDLELQQGGLTITTDTFYFLEGMFSSGGTTLADIFLSSDQPTFPPQSFTPVKTGTFTLTLVVSSPTTCFTDNGIPLESCGSLTDAEVIFSERSTVPEPATLLLVGLGVGVVGVWQRRSKT